MIVVVSVMRHWGFDEMLVSEADILDGLARSIVVASAHDASPNDCCSGPARRTRIPR